MITQFMLCCFISSSSPLSTLANLHLLTMIRSLRGPPSAPPRKRQPLPSSSKRPRRRTPLDKSRQRAEFRFGQKRRKPLRPEANRLAGPLHRTTSLYPHAFNRY
mmetsp:Transcript_22990/g.45256  ORF Transcript_22990/g.45256 Transcript_22990/m.45256 type:complete len:104 (+) Transcript_22990:515-826(+)